ncbi:MAG: cbb3-type cytochrome c oxidase subunit II [Phycisphaerales bacterium]|nr:cbb3-type cytochrome c oxidase subunit II [Phycisphaerales bacterium]
MFESKAGVLLVGGLGFFVLAFVVMALIPMTIYYGEPEKTIDDLAQDGILHEFTQLAERFPEQFGKHYGEVNYKSYGEALELGHKLYVGEGCWHCHSQYIRPVSNEDRRWGPRSYAWEYQNVLQRPVLFGTRRVGPDLIREGARKSNDWHIAHFYKPTSVVPVSVMPEYKWFFDEEGYPNKKGMAMITYIQWLGSWRQEYPYWNGEGPTTQEPTPTPDETTVARTNDSVDHESTIDGHGGAG